MRTCASSAIWITLALAAFGACGPSQRQGNGADGGSGSNGSGSVCTVGTGTCNGNVAHECNADGSGYEDVTCDAAQGVTCVEGAGCVGACAPSSLGQSYIGCEYYPTVTGNTVGKDFDFAVAIANTDTIDATVTIEDGGLTSPVTVTVPAGRVVVQILPWQSQLQMCASPTTDGCQDGSWTDAALATKGALHLRSNAPITVYQFNSLEYTKNGESSFSNDASLLMPTNVWRNHFFAASFAPLDGVGYPSELAVTAAQDNTTVTITTKADTVAAGGAPGFTTGTPQTVMLNAGDVVEISSRTGDLTGSSITSDKPVQVISGHYCADVPVGVTACDHLEESLFPVETLGTHYIVNAPAVTTEPAGKIEVIRIIATAPNISLTYDPPQAGAPTTIANAGDFVEIPNNAGTFAITASDKVMVVQYMEGQDADGAGTGDPAMTLAVPVEQYRNSYLFHAPVSYDTNYVDVVAPMGATVMLDGAPLTFTAIGGTTNFGLSRVTPLGLGPNNDGNHNISGSAPFGITVYGYGQYTSYWYPGGLNLTTILN